MMDANEVTESSDERLRRRGGTRVLISCMIIDREWCFNDLFCVRLFLRHE